MAENKKSHPIIHSETDSDIRINKYLRSTGLYSRREGDRLIEEKRVKIDGIIAVMGDKVKKGQRVMVDDILLPQDEQLIYIAFNKPVGITCTTEAVVKSNIIDYIGFDKRIFPIGRLDKDSQGLILLTNDGDIVNKILRQENNHDKEYLVVVNKPITKEFLAGMTRGVPVLNTITHPCQIRQINEKSFIIILCQGLNRQIRRMCAYFNYKVIKLERRRIMNINLGNLKSGKWRYLTEDELRELNVLIKNSIK